MKTTATLASLAFLGAALPGCAVAELDGDPVDDIGAPFPAGPEAPEPSRAILALLNDPAVDEVELDVDAGLNSIAAFYLMDHRNGDDGVSGTADDRLFDTLSQVDRIKYVGPVALERLSRYALTHGYGGDLEEGTETL